MAILRSNFPRTLLPMVGEMIGLEYDKLDSLHKKIFNTFQMDHYISTDTMSYGAGVMQEVGEAQPFQFDSMAQTWSYTYTALKYMTGFLLSYEAIRDNKYLDVAKIRSQQTSLVMEVLEETLAASIFNNAFSSGVTYGDGKALVANDHPLGYSGASVSNRPSSYIDISEAGLEQADIDIAGFTNERGLRIDCKIKGLLIPTASKYEAHRILKSTKQVYSADNTASGLYDLGTIPNIWDWRYITDSDSWYVLLENPEGFKKGVREKAMYDSDNDFMTSSARVKVMMSLCFGCSDPYRSVYASQGA